MPSITAKRKCPDLIFIKPRFDAYKAISLQIREIFAAYTPIIEPRSLDEAYLDVTQNLKGIGSATQIAEEIRATIRAETSLTASAGVSYNKFLATAPFADQVSAAEWAAPVELAAAHRVLARYSVSQTRRWREPDSNPRSLRKGETVPRRVLPAFSAAALSQRLRGGTRRLVPLRSGARPPPAISRRRLT